MAAKTDVPEPAVARAARRLVQRLDQLGKTSDERGKLTRTFLSPAMRRANAQVATWMRSAGMSVREDEFGNLIGRIEAASPAETAGRRFYSKPAFVIGSHLDTVRDAGRFDGALGVLIGIAAVEALGAAATQLPFAIEVVGFSEEEGVRFSSAYLGSKGYVGGLGARDLSRKDADGITVREALEDYRRSLPEGKGTRTGPGTRRPLGYLEVHIEQGPVLEDAGKPLGVVTAIAGQTRGRATFAGRAGHAGTTPMRLRRDALAGAAEWIGQVEACAQDRALAPLVATVGKISVQPGAANVIPGQAELTLDVRHPVDDKRTAALTDLLAAAETVAQRRKLAFQWTVTQDDAAVRCDPELTGRMERAVGGRAPKLVSGAGHDGVVISRVAPIAMLFVRCREGLSHHPAEFCAPEDIREALRATCAFLAKYVSN